jgi:uncharacterized protein (TIGR03790 family)
LCGHANRTLVLIVLLVLFISTTNAGRPVPSDTVLFTEDVDMLSDEPEMEARQGVDPLLLARYNALFNYSDVLVVRNLNSATSTEIADYFVQQRDMPPINICNVTTSPNEVIDRATFTDLMNQIIANMTIHGLISKINIIVTTKGVPLKITDSLFTDRRASVDSELALINGIYDGNVANRWWFDNPYFNSTSRHSHQKDQLYVVTRLTGYTVDDAKDLVDRATRSIGKKGRFVLDIDPRRDGSPGYKVGNDWMRVAYDILTLRGFEVFIDQSNTFVNNQTTLAGYTSWGSNDGNWYIPENTNTGFETDSNGDTIPDDWFKTDNPGLSEVIRSSADPQGGSWSVRMTRTQVNDNYTAISQNFSLIPERRYVLMGSANLTNVSGDNGVHLQIKSFDSLGSPISVQNGGVRSGTTGSYVGLGQVVYEPQTNATRLVVSAILSKSNGTVFVDNVRFIEIKPHNTWVDGAVGETYVSTGGRSFTYGTGYGQSLVADLIKDGISGVKGYVYEPYLTAVAHPDILFERYTSGWALGESFFAASEIGTSWMDLILGDPKVAPYNSSHIPDLLVDNGSFSVSNDIVMKGSSVIVEATVENKGNFPTVNATTSVFLGHPAAGGTPIHNFTRTIDYQQSEHFNFTWVAGGLSGEHDLCLFADPNDEFFELDEQNNLVCKRIRLSDGIYLEKGWNLISIPFEPFNDNVTEALRSIDGEYDTVRFFDPNGTADPWKAYYSFKPSAFNDLSAIDRRMGFWIHVLNSTVLEVNGTHYRSTDIFLRAGWNLIGYPSLKDQKVNEVFLGLPLLRIEAFAKGSVPYLLERLDGNGFMAPGKGYWVEVVADCSVKISG